MHAARIAKAYLGLGWMYIHVDGFRGERQKQGIGRMACAVQDVFVGLTYGMGKQLVAHETTVYEEILLVAAGA